MRESTIVYQCGAFWIADTSGQFTVYQDGATVAHARASFARTDDGLSLAKAYADYLASRKG